eukprot:GDKI01005658.1.p1 GENE.GDKI01005658.1~~GDKI01005658.1.p1  ORF type:complete len:219 (-),score=44.72 GDKI01005658.1:159-815(-)
MTALWAACMTAAYMFGSLLSGVILADALKFRLGKRYGYVLILESGLLVVSVLLYRFQLTDSHMALCQLVACVACGLQNAMASQFSGLVLRTTHCTGLVTDIGQTIGTTIRNKDSPIGFFKTTWRLIVLCSLYFGFVFGCFLGGLGFLVWKESVLLFPALFIGVLGLLYVLFKVGVENNIHTHIHDAIGNLPIAKSVHTMVRSMTQSQLLSSQRVATRM